MGIITIVPAYVDNASADAYFAARFPSTIWTNATSGDKTATLTTASDRIDRLNFAGEMTSASFTLTLSGNQNIGDTILNVSGNGLVQSGYLMMLDQYTYGVVSHVDSGNRTTQITIPSPGLIVAGTAGDLINVYQQRQFPRGSDILVPQEILRATCELAYSLLDGADPSVEIENINATGQGISDIKTQYDRSFNQPHILAGIPSIIAWHLLLPFLRDPSEVRVIRDSFKLGPPQSFL